MAADRAESLQQQTDELTETTENLLESNTKLRSALDSFFGRFVGDEAFRMQLSTTFRNEMVQEMLAYYENYLELHVDDDQLTLDVCERIATVTSHLLDSGTHIQANHAIVWNLKKLRRMIDSDNTNSDALSLLASVQLQACEIPDEKNYDEDYSDFAERALQNSQLAIEIDEFNQEAKRLRLIAKAQLLRADAEINADDRNVQFSDLISQLDLLSEAQPEKLKLYQDRSRLRNWLGRLSGPNEKVSLRIESIEVLKQQRDVQRKQGRTGYWTDRSIAVGTFFLGMAQMQLKNQKAAEANLNSAQEQLRNLIERTPAFIQIRMDLAEILVQVGNVKLRTNQQEEAIDFFDKAIVEFKQVSQMEDGQNYAIARRSQTNKLVAMQLIKSEQIQVAHDYVHRAVDAYRSLFSQDSNYYGPRHFQEFEKLLIFAADHFEQNGDASASSKYRQEAVKLREENAKEF